MPGDGGGAVAAAIGWRGALLRLLHGWFLVSRPLTLGVRVAAFTADGRVCLVRHTYVEGWHLPGGGVEVGEDVVTAACRELAEEAGVAVEAAALRLVGIYHNRRTSKRDHVLLFRVDDVSVPPPRRPDREIAGCGAFPLGALPDGTTPATRARLRELREALPPAVSW